MTHEDAETLLNALLPRVNRDSRCLPLSPFSQAHIRAYTVFEAIRTQMEPPISKVEFLDLTDRLEEAL